MPRLLALALLASVLPAQRAIDLVRPDDAIVVQVDGPEALRLAFLPTSLGSLLAAQEARDFWSLLGKPLLEHASKLSRLKPERALEALLGYRGRITVAVGFGDDNDGLIEGAVTLSPDGETDLAALRDRLLAFLEGGEKSRDSVRVGRWVRTYPVLGDVAVTAPVLRNNQLVVFFGNQLDTEAIARRRAPGHWVPDAEFAKSPIAVRLNLPELLSPDGTSWVGNEKLAEMLGFHSLEELRLLARPTGPRVEIELSVAFDRDERGIFNGIFPANTEPPSLVGLVPPEHRDWAVGKFGVAKLIDALLEAIEVYSPSLVDEEDWVHVIEAAAAMSEDYAQLGSLTDKSLEFGEFCLVFQLREPQAFDVGFWRSLGEDTATHAAAIAAGEVVVHRKDRAFEMVFVRWRELVFLYHGEQGEDWFEQMLERARQQYNAGNKVVTPKAIEKLRGAAGPGLQGCARLDIRQLSRALPGLRWLWPMQSDYEENTGLLRDLTAELAPLLKKYDCEAAYALTEWSDRRWRARLFW